MNDVIIMQSHDDDICINKYNLNKIMLGKITNFRGRT